jgi:hypothetical protein
VLDAKRSMEGERGMKVAFKRRAVVATWPERMLAMAVLATIALALALAIAAAASAQTRSLPNGVPDLLNPDAQREWQAYQAGNLEGNADFPLVMFVNTAGNQPAAVMMALDAQNGTDRWSLASDPIVVIALFSDPNTITRLYADSGFAQSGKASGSYTEVANPNIDTLTGLLQTVARAQHPADQQPGTEQAQRPTEQAHGDQQAQAPTEQHVEDQQAQAGQQSHTQ